MARQRLNFYFADGATYSYLDDVDHEEGEYRVGADEEQDEVVEVYTDQNERLPHLVDSHGDVTILVISPA